MSSFENITLFSAVKRRLSWLTQRQEVLAQNIANSDTPKYRSRDLKAYNFKDVVRREAMQLNIEVSDPSHLPGKRKRLRDFSQFEEPRPFETSPNGNSVIVEEQMAKINGSQISHRLTTNLYKKHLNMFRIALGKS